MLYIYIYGNIYHQYTPVMLAHIPAPWIRHGKWIIPISSLNGGQLGGQKPGDDTLW